VQKVVPTLTSRSAEIYLSMVGAKPLVTLSFILVPAGPYVQQGCARRALYCVAPWCLRRGLQVRRERRPVLQVPEVLIEANANIVVKVESVQVSAVRRPLRLGDCSSFYRPRRRQFTSVPHCFIYVWGYGVQCRGVDGRPGESCIWWGVMACPVSVQERLRGWRCRGRPFGRCRYMGSRMRLTGGRGEDHVWFEDRWMVASLCDE
jgi:hypothetical protein